MKAGDEGLARLGGRWIPARITAVHPTGTLSVVDPTQGFMADWHSLCPHHWSDDDLGRLSTLARGADEASAEQVGAWFAAVGAPIAPDVLQRWWTHSSQQQFGDVLPSRPLADIHALLLAAGWCARSLDPAEPPIRWHPLWWNQVRMGGGRPEDGPTIGVAEARQALGLKPARDPAAVAALTAFESANALRLPDELRSLVELQGFADAFRGSHCNDPEWRSTPAWTVLRDLSGCGVAADVGIDLVEPHQGDHTWVIAIRENGETAGIYLRYPTSETTFAYQATAPTLAYWLWDLARAGADWQRGINARVTTPTAGR